RREQRDLVQVLDHDVELEVPEVAAVIGRCRQTECMAPARAVHVHPVHDLALRGARPAGNEQRHLVAPRREPAEDLVQVGLGAPRAGVQPVLPVHDEDLQDRPPSRGRRSCGRCCRISASSTPLTKRGLSTVPYFSARTMASWMETGDGTSSTYRISAAATRRMLRSMAARRSSRQLVSAACSAASIVSLCSATIRRMRSRYPRLAGAILRSRLKSPRTSNGVAPGARISQA